MSSKPLELQESLASRPSPIGDDGTVLVHLIRPTVGQGRGKHLYEASMLQENADVFTGWKMYIDHQSPEAKKAAGGLPRSIRDLGGRIIESYWDDSVPAHGRFGPGAVVGKVRPVGQVKKLIEDDPELLEASIRAKATDVRQTEKNGEQVWAVEGIRRDPPGSVDWVSEGGAGGRVVADLIEALVQEGDAPDEPTAEGGDEVSELLEALKDPESDVAKAVTELAEAKATATVETRLAEQQEKHEKELEEAREESREDAKAEAQRQIQLRDLRDEAHREIEEAKLPDALAEKMRGEYDLVDDEPTSKLDVEDKRDEDGKVVRSAMKQLQESVSADIVSQRKILAEVSPTKVEGQGPVATDGDTAPAKQEKGFHREWLEEAGMDPDEAWGDKKINTGDEPTREKENV